MNRQGQGRPLQSVTNIGPPSQPRTTTNGRIQANKPNTWAQGNLPSLQTGQNREAGSIADNWAQATTRSIPQLDLSASSFPSLNNSGPSQNHTVGSSAWQTGPPQAEVQRLQNRNQIQSRQSNREGFYPDSFSRQDYSEVQPRRSSQAPAGPPGLSQRQTLTDSGELSRVTSPGGLQSSRSPMPRPDTLSQSGDRNDYLQSPEDRNYDNYDNPDQIFESLFEGMSEKEKWGLKGYVAMADGPNAAFRSLMRGQDLSTLGLDMTSEGPILSSYPGPFSRPNAHPLRPLESEFNIPDCYTVQKVAPLQSRISGFTDDTLFYIFYTKPRDYMQVLVAQELMERKWRYHMREQMWMTRDESTSAPVLLDDKVSEHGYYIWWDKNLWKKVRRPYTLRYEDLDDQPSMANRRMPGVMAEGANGSAFNAVPGLERIAASGRGF